MTPLPLPLLTHTRTSLLLASPFLALALLACTDTGTQPEDFTPSDPEDPGYPLGDTDSATWAMKQVVSVQVASPTGGDEWGSVITTRRMILQWNREGTNITWTDETCSMSSTSVYDTLSSYGYGFITALPLNTRDATLSVEEVGADFEAERYTELMGVVLDDPEEETLPEDEEDERVVDSDEDENPGVTVDVHQEVLDSYGELYMIQRNRSTYHGVVVNPDRIEGNIDYELEQIVVGYSVGWLAFTTAVRADADSSHNYFILVRMEDGDNCAAVEAGADTLFE